MINIKMILIVALGGAIGTVARFLMMSGIGHFWRAAFPLSTFLVNVLGSFLIGVLVELMMNHHGFNLAIRTFLIVGILGGFTTFSSFSLDIGLLLQKGELIVAAAYILGSVFVSLFAFFAGMMLFR